MLIVNITKVMKDAVYSFAQEYANTGFEVLADYMAKEKDSELVWNLLKELDSQYAKIIEKDGMAKIQSKLPVEQVV